MTAYFLIPLNQWSACQLMARSVFDLVLRKQKLVVWFQLQCGSHRLLSRNTRTRISCSFRAVFPA